MSKTLNRIEKTYSAVAEVYAEAFFDEHRKKPMDREMLERFVREMGDRQPVWDFGCGPGQTAKFLKDAGQEISGLDLSEELLDQARRLYPDIPFQKGNLLDLDFENASIAGVVAFYAIVHFTRDQVEKAFQEVFRVLKPNGILLFTFHVGGETLHIDTFLGREVDIDFMLFPAAFISQSLKTAGFTLVEIVEREPYPDVEYPSRRAYVFARKPSP
ncbi:MAG: methyltransferase domain-containing protein [Desulfobacterales bacterium]|nr:methyltransferase domain-containing protein [Desulfobacterales bacterium]